MEAINEFLCNNQFDNVNEAITKAILYANQAILDRAQIQPELTGMGSTCVMIIIRNGIVHYGHVGDSRIYIVSNRIIKQLTTDHSFVQMLVDSGKITKEEAERHPRKNEITNALGIPNMQAPTVCKKPIAPEAGTCFLLCSDGLTGMIDDKRIEKVLCNRNLSLENRAKELVRLANEAGGVDNITAQLVEFALGTSDIDPNDEKITSGSKKGKRGIVVGVIGTIVLLIVVFFVYKLLYEKHPLPDPKPKTETQIIGHSILYSKGKQIPPVKPPLPGSYKFTKNSCTIVSEYQKFVIINDVGDNIYMKWTDTEFSGNKIVVEIETDSIKFFVSFPVEKNEEPKIDNKNEAEKPKGANQKLESLPKNGLIDIIGGGNEKQKNGDKKENNVVNPSPKVNDRGTEKKTKNQEQKKDSTPKGKKELKTEKPESPEVNDPQTPEKSKGGLQQAPDTTKKVIDKP